MRFRQAAKREGLNLVWIKDSCSTMLPLGLEKALRAEAHVHRGHTPPVGGSLSCVILCSNNEEDVALEVKRLLAMAPGVPCVVFGLRADLQLARSALKAGARGFIHAEMHPERVVCALSLASKGEVVLPGELLEEAAE